MQVDERWMREWLDFGFSELEIYLAKYTEFDRYLARNSSTTQERNNLRTTN